MQNLPANMFPQAPAGAPDLQDAETPSAPASAGFPAAPAASALVYGASAHAQPRTKPEQAIAYLQKNGPTTREELSAHLGIKRDALSAYIGTAVRDGRIELGKTMAMLGTGKANPVGRPPKDKAPAPVPAEAKPEPIKADAAPSQASLSCGHLYVRVSVTGALEIGVGHKGVQLNEAQAALLRMFLAEACAE